LPTPTLMELKPSGFKLGFISFTKACRPSCQSIQTLPKFAWFYPFPTTTYRKHGNVYIGIHSSTVEKSDESKGAKTCK